MKNLASFNVNSVHDTLVDVRFSARARSEAKQHRQAGWRLALLPHLGTLAHWLIDLPTFAP